MKNIIGALILGLIITAGIAHAAWGDFDTSFGFLGAAIDGSVSSHHPLGVAVQADGKILLTGYRLVSGRKRFFLRRYLSNGNVDTSFGNNGSAISNAIISTEADYAGHRIVVQANGRIAVAGVGNQYATIWRFLSSGSSDSSIGYGGMRTLSSYPTTSSAPAMTTYSNILYVGLRKADDSRVIIKYNSDGTRDMSFGGSGEAVTDAGQAFSIQTDPTSGNILLSGRQRSNYWGYGVERFLPTGAVDTTFNNWSVTYDGDPQGQPKDFVRLSNGQFALNERWHNLGQGGILFGANLVRLSSSGAFTNRSVYQTTEFYSLGDVSYGNCPDLTSIQSDGKVIMTPSNVKRLYRFSTNFATIQTHLCSNYANVSGRTHGVLQSDDKMIAAGTYNGDIIIVRTLP